MLDTFKTEQRPLEFVVPGKVRSTRIRNAWMAALNNLFPPVVEALAVTGILWNIGDQARIEDALPIVCRIKTAIEIEIGTSEVQPDLFGHFLQRCKLSGNSTMSVALTGATGTGAKTEP